MRARFGTLKLRLALGAGLIGAFAILASGLSIVGAGQMSAQVDRALAAEQRIQRYTALAAQVGTYLVMGFEASQSDAGRKSLINRLQSQTTQIQQTFVIIREDLADTVSEAQSLGVDAQSERATRSLGVARMEALFNSTHRQLLSAASENQPVVMQGQLNGFSIAFDPLINAAVSEQRHARDQAIAQVSILRRELTRMAIALAVIAAGLLLAFYFVLIRPQMRRLSDLGEATRQIAQGDFSVSLPTSKPDEIGTLFDATNAMASALSTRAAEVAEDQRRLNDIVDQRTKELQIANEALAKTDADRRRLFADISHELRTPLTVILMEAELALKAGEAPSEAFQTIQTRAQRLNRRIDDLLRIARSETGALTLKNTAFDLAKAAKLAVTDIESQIQRAGLTLTQSETMPIEVHGDEDWARQVITGLIENTIRHAKSGGRVHLLFAETPKFGTIHVIDNGAGFSAADQPRMLERFAQGKGPAKSEGFGIGLSLAHWILEEQGGQITLASPVPPDLRLGDAPGAMVSVSLPKNPGKLAP